MLCVPVCQPIPRKMQTLSADHFRHGIPTQQRYALWTDAHPQKTSVCCVFSFCKVDTKKVQIEAVQFFVYCLHHVNFITFCGNHTVKPLLCDLAEDSCSHFGLGFSSQCKTILKLPSPSPSAALPPFII